MLLPVYLVLVYFIIVINILLFFSSLIVYFIVLCANQECISKIYKYKNFKHVILLIMVILLVITWS